MTGEPAQRSLPDTTRLAVERTRLAYERTLTSWVRTAISLITFGFTIYKFFEYLRETRQVEQAERILGPRAVGILMISLGLFALLLATVQHRRSMQALRAEFGGAPVSLAGGVAGLISLLGIAALIAAVFRQ